MTATLRRTSAEPSVPELVTLELADLVESPWNPRTPGYYQHAESLKNVSALGIDVKRIVERVAPKAKPAQQSSPKKRSSR